jgi:signal transduction histidine kinase
VGDPQTPAFAVEQREGLIDFWTVYEQLAERLPESPMEAALHQPETAPFLQADLGEILIEQTKRSRLLVRQAIADGDWQPYINNARELGARFLAVGASFSTWYAVVRVFHARVMPALVDAYVAQPARLKRALAAMAGFVDFSTCLIAEQYAELNEYDLTVHKKIEATLEHRTHQLEDSNRDLEAFSYSVAHDLRAPLRAMNGFAQILLEDYPTHLEPEAVGYLQKIQANAMRMGSLIDALLGLSRLSRSQLQLQPVDLTALARAVVAQLVVSEPSRVVDVTVDAGLHAIADTRLMRVVFDNLIGNAWKFTRKQPEPRITIGSTEGRTFFVRDNGAGFDMGHAGKLFTPFERMHTTSEFPGTGIGLATVQRIIHRHRGRIWVKAQPNAGATFFFTLAP